MEQIEAVANALVIVDPSAKWLVKSFHDFQQEHSEQKRAILSARTRASYVHDTWAHYLAMEFGRDGPVCVKQKYGLTYLLIRDKTASLALTLKKLHRGDLRSCNYPTQQSETLREEGVLPFQTEVEHAILGYTENGDPINPDVHRMWLKKEKHKRTLWACSLWSCEKAEPIPIQVQRLIAPIERKAFVRLTRAARERAKKMRKKKG